MPRVILLDPCLDPRWDAFVERHPFGWVTHLSGWKRVLESSFPHMTGHYLALVDEAGEIQAGLPLFEVRSPILGNRLVSIPFATLCDPLVEEENEFRLLLGVAGALLGSLKIKHLEVRTHFASNLIPQDGMGSGHMFKSHYMYLTPSLEKLFSSFHRHGVRYMIKKAGRLHYEMTVVSDREGLKDFYDTYLATRKRLGLPPQPYRFFLELWSNLSPRGNVVFLLAKLDGSAAGGLMLFRFKNRTSAEAMGLDESLRQKGPHFFLFWEAIKLAREQGFKVFDFGRTAVDNYGLMTFKSRWGTKVVDLPQLFLYNGITPTRTIGLLSLNNPSLRRFCSKLPMPLFKALGRACYMHMG